MEIEMLKNLHEIYKSKWGPQTERKINRLIQGMEDPKWKNIRAFFQDDDETVQLSVSANFTSNEEKTCN